MLENSIIWKQTLTKNVTMSEYDLGIILAVIIALGTCGNVLSFTVLVSGRRCRKLFCSAYLIAIAITDTIILLLPAFELCFYLLTNTILRTLSPFLCKFLTFVLYYSAQVSSWIVVGVCTARAVSIWMPLRTRTWQSRSAIPYILIMMTVLFIVDLPLIIDAERISIHLDSNFLKNLSDIIKELNLTDSEDIFQQNKTVKADSFIPQSDNPIDISFCLLKANSIYARGKSLRPIVVDLCLIFAIPFCIITLSNSLIIVKLCIRIRVFRGDEANKACIKESRIASLTARVLVLSIVHCLSTGPIAIAEVMKASSLENEVTFMIHSTLFKGLNLLFYLNSGVNFILYCLFGGEFRQDLLDMLRPRRK